MESKSVTGDDVSVIDSEPGMSTQLLASVAPKQWAPSFFGVVPTGAVRRRPTDIIHLLLAVLLIALCSGLSHEFAQGPDGIEQWLRDLPDLLNTAGSWLFLSCTIGAVVVVAAALLFTRKFRLVLILTGVAAATVGITRALISLTDPNVEASLSAAGIVWLAVATAVLLSSAPYLVSPARRLVRTIQLLAAVGAIVAVVGAPAVVVAAVGIGWAVSAIANLVFGTPKATPTLHSVVEVLKGLGISIDQLELADAQPWGETRFTGRAIDKPASVVVIGRDASDARFLSKTWRTFMYRDAGPAVSVSRSAQIEHRAYLLLMAANAGARVSKVVMAATTGPEANAYLVLVDPVGKSLAEVDPSEISDAALDDMWSNLSRLHTARLTHGQLAPTDILLADDGSTSFVDFSRGSSGADRARYLADEVDLLATTAVLVGDERALSACKRAIGSDGIAELLPMIQTAALSPVVLRAVPDSKKRIKALRQAAAELSGSEEPKLTELRRVSIGSLVMVAATFVGFYLIVAQFAGVDLKATLADAEVGWVFVTFVLSFVPQFSSSIALMGTVAKPLPFKPVLAEQLANNFTGLIGGTMATTALVIRFFQKQGLEVAIAATSGVMNAVASSIVQAVLIILGLILTGSDFTLSTTGGSGYAKLILLMIIGGGLLITIAVVVPRIRHKLVPQVKAARKNLGVILKNPRKAAMIFGGNLCSQIFFALVICAALQAYGTSLPLAQVIVINSLASFVGGMAPIPGGMGVIEAGLIGGMTAAGVPNSEAVAATFTARLFTSYLPPIWGWMSLSWLRRHDYV